VETTTLASGGITDDIRAFSTARRVLQGHGAAIDGKSVGDALHAAPLP
jgi:hypothetical protein